MKRLQNTRGKPDPNKAEVRKMLKPVMQALTDPNEERRQDNVRRLLSASSPSILRLVIDRLVELLTTRRESIRRQAVTSLAQIGSAALPALTIALVKSRRPAVQRAAAETLLAMLPQLQQEQLLDSSFATMMAMGIAKNDAVGMALAKLMAAVRQALDSTPRPGAVIPGLPGQVGGGHI